MSNITQIYNKIGGGHTTSILKDDFTVDKTEFEKDMINRQYDKLNFNSMNDSFNLEKKKDNQRIYNLSLLDIAKNTSKTVMDIMNDMSILIKNNNRNYNNYIEVIIKEDRMIYVGVMFIVLALAIFFISVSV